MMSRIQNINSDRISSLPDSILHEIFSFLPTEDVVRTGVLSKRWKNLWISLPYLRFTLDKYITLDKYMSSYGRGSQKYKKFLHNKITRAKFIANDVGYPEFVNNIMLQRDKYSRIIRFRLQCGKEARGFQIHEWISIAVSAEVQELDIFHVHDFSITAREILPPCLFTCNSLVALKLHVDCMPCFPEVFSLPNLKSMHLHFIILPKNFADQLLKSPNLEELALINCGYGLAYWIVRRSTADQVQVQVQVQDPEKKNGMVSSKLKKTIISPLYIFDNQNRYIDRGMVNGFSKLIRHSHTVDILRLSHQCIRLLHHKRHLFEYLPTFCNLKHLEIGICNVDVQVGVLGCLLHLCPVLESLAIQFNNQIEMLREIVAQGTSHDFFPRILSELEEETSTDDTNSDRFFGRAERKLEPEESKYHSLCAPPSLKWIEVTNYRGLEIQFQLLKFFSANAQGLQQMTVKLRRRQYENVMLLQELLSLPKLFIQCK